MDDKYFQWGTSIHPNFELNPDNGTITIKSNASEGTYLLKFIVTEEAPPLIEKHEVDATVNVTVKYILEEAVIKSGSIRLKDITVEEFIEKDSVSKLFY